MQGTMFVNLSHEIIKLREKVNVCEDIINGDISDRESLIEETDKAFGDCFEQINNIFLAIEEISDSKKLSKVDKSDIKEIKKESRIELDRLYTIHGKFEKTLKTLK